MSRYDYTTRYYCPSCVEAMPESSSDHFICHACGANNPSGAGYRFPIGVFKIVRSGMLRKHERLVFMRPLKDSK